MYVRHHCTQYPRSPGDGAGSARTRVASSWQLLKGYWELHLGPLRSNSALNHQAAVSLVLSFWLCLFVLLFCFVFLIDLFVET